jgi:flagellar biosynthesis protein FlhG
MQGVLDRIHRNRSPKKEPSAFPRVISIIGAKGGVGTTNVVANLGLAFTQMGMRVLILETNFGLGNLNTFLGLNPAYTIEDFFEKEKSLFDILTVGPGGMMIIPSSPGNHDLTNLDLNRNRFLLTEIERLEDRVDILLIDAGAGISANALFFNAVAQKVLILSAPEPTSLKNACALIKVFSEKHVQKDFMILINQAANDHEAKEIFKDLYLKIDRSLQSVRLEYVGFIPFDENIRQAVRYQRPVLDLFPKSPVSQKFIDLARLFSENLVFIKEKENAHFFQQKPLPLTYRFGVRTAFGSKIYRFQK